MDFMIKIKRLACPALPFMLILMLGCAGVTSTKEQHSTTLVTQLFFNPDNCDAIALDNFNIIKKLDPNLFGNQRLPGSTPNPDENAEEFHSGITRLETERETCHYRNAMIGAYTYESVLLQVSIPTDESLLDENTAYLSSKHECDYITDATTGQRLDFSEYIRKVTVPIPILSTHLRNSCITDRASIIVHAMVAADRIKRKKANGTPNPNFRSEVDGAIGIECGPLKSVTQYVSVSRLLGKVPYELCTGKVYSGLTSPATIG